VSTCLFCSIALKDVEATILLEGETCVAFLDLYPLSWGHCLVIPRRHCNDLTELEPEEYEELFHTGNRVLKALRENGLGVDGANYLVNDGSAANQHIPHLHLHVIPRQRGDTFRAMFKFFIRALGPLGRAASRRRLEELAAQLRQSMEE
jgi:histidine triad (HIT) family protein